MCPTAGPRELKRAIVSSLRDNVPIELDAPTVRTHGESAGDANAAPDLLAVDLSVVAGRGHDDDALLNERLRGQRERVVLEESSSGCGAERQVHDADAVRGAVVGQPVERRDDVRDCAVALVVQHLDDDELRARRGSRHLHRRSPCRARR